MLRILQMSDSLLCAHSCFDLALSDLIFLISALQNTNGCIGNSRVVHSTNNFVMQPTTRFHIHVLKLFLKRFALYGCK
jgi:hypothetical protein